MILFTGTVCFLGLYTFEKCYRGGKFSGSCFDVFIMGRNQVLF